MKLAITHTKKVPGQEDSSSEDRERERAQPRCRGTAHQLRSPGSALTPARAAGDAAAEYRQDEGSSEP